MKTRFILMAMFATLAISCAKEILPENNVADNTDVAPVSMEFVAGLESKAAIVDGEKTVEWVAGDQICVFDNLGGDNAFKTEASGKTVSFAGQVSGGANEFYALYPYRSGAEFDAETKVVTSKLFPDQKAVLGSYAKAEGGAVMAAKVSDGNVLSFKNMTSHIRFTLAEDLEDVISITLMGNKGEALAGLYNVDFNGEVPVLTVSKAETYVTLRNEDESVLTPGDYFFTVLPVEFTEGFTVILSMSDGSQLAKKTTKSITSLGERNKVLPMAKLNYSDYKPHMNYFVLYNDGFELTFGGYTFDKTTHPGGKLVNDTYGNGTIGKDGIYFIDPNATQAKISAASAYSKLMIIGAESGMRSNFDFVKQARPYENGEYILMANMNCTFTLTSQPFAQNKKTEGHAYTEFGKIIFDNCHFEKVPGNFMQFNVASSTADAIVIENCEFGFNAPATYLLNFGDTNESSVNNLSIRNNVFYASADNTMTDFRLVNGIASSLKNINYIQNTMDHTRTTDKGYFYLAAVEGECNVYDNLYVEAHVAATSTPIVNASSYSETFTCVIEDNFYYVDGVTKALSAGKNLPANQEGVIKTGRPRSLTFYPLVDGWNPATGSFGYKAGLQYYDQIGDSTPKGDVPANCGAQRGTAAEPANYAAAGYSSVNLGNY